MPTETENKEDVIDVEVTPVIPIRPPDKAKPPRPRRPSIGFPWSHAFAFSLGAVVTYLIMKRRD